jgi:hypothetical protein
LIEELEARPLYAADLFEVPDFVEPVVAYRKWRVVDGRLRSLYMPVFWTEREQQAVCRHAPGAHMAPNPACVCGIYASHKPDYEFPTIDFRGVIGLVTVWGSVEVHADGLRAEYARVEALSLYERWTIRQLDAVREVAEALGVDLIRLDELESAADRYGAPLPKDLLVSVS